MLGSDRHIALPVQPSADSLPQDHKTGECRAGDSTNRLATPTDVPVLKARRRSRDHLAVNHRMQRDCTRSNGERVFRSKGSLVLGNYARGKSNVSAGTDPMDHQLKFIDEESGEQSLTTPRPAPWMQARVSYPRLPILNHLTVEYLAYQRKARLKRDCSAIARIMRRMTMARRA